MAKKTNDQRILKEMDNKFASFNKQIEEMFNPKKTKKQIEEEKEFRKIEKELEESHKKFAKDYAKSMKKLEDGLKKDPNNKEMKKMKKQLEDLLTRYRKE